jgi:hypothetical protein
MTALFRLLAGVALVIATTGSGLGQPTVPSLATPLGSAAQGDQLEDWARQNGDALIPTCRFEGARCGYLDRAGNTVIAPEFDWVDRFVAGRALVGKDRRYGAIDETGKLVVPPIYDRMSSFDRNLAQVLVGDRLGVINQDGQWVVPAEHGLIVRISDDAFLVAEPHYADARWPKPLHALGDRLARSLPSAYGKRWGIVGRGGAWIVRPQFAQVRAFSDDLDGLFWASDSGNVSARWRLMSADGAPVSDNWFDDVQQSRPGQDRAIVQRGERWGAINSKGEIAVELRFDWLGYYRDGWAPYKLAEREGRIDRDGNVPSDTVIQPRSSDANTKLGALVDGKPLFTDRAGATLLGTTIRDARRVATSASREADGRS